MKRKQYKIVDSIHLTINFSATYPVQGRKEAGAYPSYEYHKIINKENDLLNLTHLLYKMGHFLCERHKNDKKVAFEPNEAYV